MSTTPPSGQARIRIYLDFDGTLATDLIAYKFICEDIPELNYYPGPKDPVTGERIGRIDLKTLIEMFISERARLDSLGIRNDGPTVCNSVLLRLVRDGTFAGLNNRILHAVGRKIELFPGVVDFMKDALHVVETVSNNTMTVDFVILSAGLRAGTLGTALGQLTEGPNPLVADITGQEFVEEGGEWAWVADTFKPSDKGEYLRSDVRNGIVLHQHQIAIGDGGTDGPMFHEAIMRDEYGRHGASIIVGPAEPGNVEHTEKRQSMTQFRDDNPGMDGVYNANWASVIAGETGQLHNNVMMILERMVQNHVRQLQGQSRLTRPGGRAGTPPGYADTSGKPARPRQIALLSAPSRHQEWSNASVTSRNATLPINNPFLVRVVRTLAQYDVRRLAFTENTSRQLLRGEQTGVLRFYVPVNHPKNFGLIPALAALTGATESEISIPKQGETKAFRLPSGERLVLIGKPYEFKHHIDDLHTGIRAGRFAAVCANGKGLFPLSHDLTRPLDIVRATNAPNLGLALSTSSPGGPALN